MADNKTLDQNIAEAQFEQRQLEREAAGGGRALSPADAAGMGANPDQAKMTGVNQPNARPNALNEALTQAKAQKSVAQDQMYEALKREKSLEEEQLTDDQKKTQKLAEELKGLGSIDSLVQKAVTQSFEEAKGVEADFDQASVDSLASKGNEATVQAGIGAFNEKFASIPLEEGPARQAAIEDAYSEIVKLQDSGAFEKGKSSQAILTLLKSSINTDEEVVKTLTAKAFSEGIVDAAELDMNTLEEMGVVSFPEDPNDPMPEFGDLSPNQLQGILGPDFKDMNPEEIGRIVENRVLKDAHEKQNIMATISDPNLSPVLKEAMQNKLAQVEASGLAAIEENAEASAREVLAAGSVMFGGEVRDIEDLLDDSNIQAEVMDYLSKEDGDRQDSQFFRDNPEFANAIEQTFGAGMDVAENFKEAVTEFEGLQEDYKAKIDKESGDITKRAGEPPTDAVLKMFDLDKDSLVSEMPEMNDFWNLAKGNASVIQSMNSWNSETQKKFGDWMKSAKGADRERMKKVLSNPNLAQGFSDVQDMGDKLDGVAKSGDDKELKGLMGVLFGESADAVGKAGFRMDQTNSNMYADPQDIVDKLRLESSMNPNAKKATSVLGILDANKDGKLDSAADIRKNMKKLGSNGSIEDMIKRAEGLTSTRDTVTEGAGVSSTPTSGWQNKSTASIRDDVLKNDLFVAGKWDWNGVRNHINSMPSPSDVTNFYQSLMSSGMNMRPDEKREFEKFANHYAKKSIESNPVVANAKLDVTQKTAVAKANTDLAVNTKDIKRLEGDMKKQLGSSYSPRKSGETDWQYAQRLANKAGNPNMVGILKKRIGLMEAAKNNINKAKSSKSQILDQQYSAAKSEMERILGDKKTSPMEKKWAKAKLKEWGF